MGLAMTPLRCCLLILGEVVPFPTSLLGLAIREEARRDTFVLILLELLKLPDSKLL